MRERLVGRCGRRLPRERLCCVASSGHVSRASDLPEPNDGREEGRSICDRSLSHLPIWHSIKPITVRSGSAQPSFDSDSFCSYRTIRLCSVAGNPQLGTSTGRFLPIAELLLLARLPARKLPLPAARSPLPSLTACHPLPPFFLHVFFALSNLPTSSPTRLLLDKLESNTSRGTPSHLPTTTCQLSDPAYTLLSPGKAVSNRTINIRHPTPIWTHL